jgi:hypothetical protein
MKPKKRFTWSLMALALLAAFGAARALYAQIGVYRQVALITVPGNLSGGFDISWADAVSGRYYLANRGDATAMPPVPAHIDVIDTKHLKYLYSLNTAAGGNGVVAINNPHSDVDNDPESAGELWVGENPLPGNPSKVEVFDLKTKMSVTTISTGGVARADELAYDPLDHVLLIANDRETTCTTAGVCTGPAPFITFINTETRTVLGAIDYPQVVFGDPTTMPPTPASNHGLEQPVWDPKTAMFYLAVPATSDNPAGEVDEIDPAGLFINRIFPTTCNPAGLVLVPRGRLVTSCGDVIGIGSGNVLTTVANVGADEIWYNPGEERVYFGGFQRIRVPIVNANNFNLVATLTVGVINPTPPPPSQTTHSVAADSENNLIFVPVGNAGVKVYTDRRRSVDENP